jgi:hypothetical protein
MSLKPGILWSFFALLLSAACVPALAAAPSADTAAQTAAKQPAGFGPIDPAPPVGISTEEIVKRMAAQETDFEAARNDYGFRQTVKIDTINDDTGRPDGEYQQISNISFDDAGKRLEHVVFAPASTIERVILTTTDMDEIANRLPFILTTAQLPEYDLTYLGRQRIDDLDTYVFSVKPKTYEKHKHYVEGKVWLDQQDFEIVLINGITVPQDMRRGHEDLSPPFSTYYQQIDGKYWFPTYTKAEGVLHFAAQNGALSQDVHMRSTVLYTDYRRFRTSVRILYNGEELDSTPKPDATRPGTAPPQPR